MNYLGTRKALQSPGEHTPRQCWRAPGKVLEDLHPQLKQVKLDINT